MDKVFPSKQQEHIQSNFLYCLQYRTSYLKPHDKWQLIPGDVGIGASIEPPEHVCRRPHIHIPRAVVRDVVREMSSDQPKQEEHAQQSEG